MPTFEVSDSEGNASDEGETTSTFEVPLKRIETTTVTVEADSKEKAEISAVRQVSNGEIAPSWEKRGLDVDPNLLTFEQ